MTKRNLAFLVLAWCLIGCRTTIPISLDSPRLPFATAIGAVAVYLYKDNWTVEETRTASDRFHLTLKKNMLRMNGDSEADLLFKRRAAEITAEHGFDGYQIMEYSEGIESATLGAQRVAQGTIRCYKTASGK